MSVREVYLDHNSTTPPHPTVLEAMSQSAKQLWGNPSSVHATGRRARDVLEATRETLARLLDFHPRDVVFTSGGTEANNLGLAGARALVVSRLEHPSVVRMAEELERHGRPVNWVPVPPSGRLSVQAVARALESLPDPGTATVALMAVNHETGVIQPVREVAQLVHGLGARLHVDAVQWLGKGPLDALAGADSIAVASHKIGGPKGIGALVFRGTPPSPVLRGGAQERGLRGGTQDAWLALGFGVALERSASGPERFERVRALREALEAGLTHVALRNGDDERLPHVSNLSFPNFPGPEFVAAADLLGLRLSSGSACSAGTSEPSAVISAMLGVERAATAVRFSLGESNDLADVERAIDVALRVLGR